MIIRQPGGDRVRLTLVALAVPAVLLGGGALLLGKTPITFTIWSVMVAVLTLRLWWNTLAALTGTPPALTPDGIRLRPRPSRRATTTLPWSAVDALGILPVGPVPRMYLKITMARPSTYPGPRHDGVYFVYLPPAAVTPQQVKDAIEHFSYGRLSARDEAPQRSLLAKRP